MNPRSKSLRTKDGERLTVHPHCLMFFVDETGNETFADPQNPVFGLGGCALLAAAIDPILRTPWQTMKALHFGGAGVPLHASELAPVRLHQRSLRLSIHFFVIKRLAALPSP